MPLYSYEHTEGKGENCSDVLEVLQNRSEEPLKTCPVCGKPCRRKVSFKVASVKSERETLSAKNLARHGFTQYKKSGDGYYEKTAGDGPQVISADSLPR